MSKKQKAMDYLKANPNAKMAEVAEATGVSMPTVQNARKEMGLAKPRGAKAAGGVPRARKKVNRTPRFNVVDQEGTTPVETNGAGTATTPARQNAATAAPGQSPTESLKEALRLAGGAKNLLDILNAVEASGGHAEVEKKLAEYLEIHEYFGAADK